MIWNFPSLKLILSLLSLLWETHRAESLALMKPVSRGCSRAVAWLWAARTRPLSRGSWDSLLPETGREWGNSFLSILGLSTLIYEIVHRHGLKVHRKGLNSVFRKGQIIH